MTFDTNEISNFFTTGITAIFGYFINSLFGRIKTTEDDVKNISLKIASELVEKKEINDLQKSVDEIKQTVSAGTVLFVEIQKSQEKIEHRLESLCNCFMKNSGNNQ